MKVILFLQYQNHEEGSYLQTQVQSLLEGDLTCHSVSLNSVGSWGNVSASPAIRTVMPSLMAASALVHRVKDMGFERFSIQGEPQ